MTFFRSFLTSIADAGRELLDGRSGVRQKKGDLRGLCADLITQKGEALGTALACAVIENYEGLDTDGKHAFFTMLLDEFDVDTVPLTEAIEQYRQSPSGVSAQQLHTLSEARRQHVLRGINMAPGGTRSVINMREDLLRAMANDDTLKLVDADFAHVLSSWFNRGFLELRRIDWNTPANILEKLITYEAVHEIRDWNDLRRRLDYDRRCYAFFHPALPDEPLIFVEIALVNGLSGSVQALLDETQDLISDTRADTAIFYSISNCQKGLRGISFGNFLIKQVVSELQDDLPNLKTFSTLSPVPGFMGWLNKAANSSDDIKSLLEMSDDPNWINDPAACTQLETPLKQLCAHYLVNVKRKGRPLNAVARFHLGNGARLERINWLGDVSKKGLAESSGILVNYKYDLSKIEKNHEQFANDGKVVCSREVEALLDALSSSELKLEQ